jgi:hypothetical protein
VAAGADEQQSRNEQGGQRRCDRHRHAAAICAAPRLRAWCGDSIRKCSAAAAASRSDRERWTHRSASHARLRALGLCMPANPTRSLSMCCGVVVVPETSGADISRCRRIEPTSSSPLARSGRIAGERFRRAMTLFPRAPAGEKTATRSTRCHCIQDGVQRADPTARPAAESPRVSIFCGRRCR